MSEPLRLQRTSYPWREGSVGCWTTRCRGFTFTRLLGNERWVIFAREENQALLERHGLERLSFPTRKGALQRLEDALRLEEAQSE